MFDTNSILLWSCLVAGVAIFNWTTLGGILFYFLGLLASAVLGVLGYLALRLTFSSRYPTNPKYPELASQFQRTLVEAINEANDEEKLGDLLPGNTSPFISRSIDQEINEVIDDVTERFLFSWLRDLFTCDGSQSELEIKKIIRRDVWSAMKNLTDRVAKIDPVNFITGDVVRRVTSHFEKIRLAQQRVSSPSMTSLNQLSSSAKPEVATFYTYPHLASQEREEEFLMKLSEVLIGLLLPTSYSKCSETRHLLKDLLGRKVLYYVIDTITNPEFVNSKIIAWITKLQTRTSSSIDGNTGKCTVHSKAFNYSASYDEFLASISLSTDTEALKHLRFNILTEIVQATQLNHLNSAKGYLDDVRENESENSHPTSTGKLKHYIRQLDQAREFCEKRLDELQDRACLSSYNSLEDQQAPELTLKKIMNSTLSRKYLYAFLEGLNPPQHDLLGFWTAIEELKEADRTEWHQLGTEIFYTYINKPNGAIRVRRSGLKQIEDFLLGDTPPSVFYEIQADVLRTLEEKYLTAFLCSDLCRKMLTEARENGISLTESTDSEDSAKNEHFKSEETSLCEETEMLGRTTALNFVDQSSFVKSQLEHVVERLQNKMQALKALKTSLKPDSKVLKMLQGEIEGLEEDRHQMEQHLMRTEAWSEHLGRWRCHIQSVEHLEELECLQVVLIVHVPIDESRRSVDEASAPPPPPSWVCTRQIGEFHSLHRSLTPYVSWIKSVELPTSPKSIFGGGKQTSKLWQDKAKSLLQNYLDKVLVDDKLNQSEIVYSFLSPSPDYLKTASSLPPSIMRSTSRSKRPRARTRQPQKFATSISSLFRHEADGTPDGCDDETNYPPKRDDFSFIRSASGDSSAQEDDEHFWLDEFDASRNLDDDVPSGDAIAEPLYALISEVFDMRGVFKILRKSLIAVVQMTYSVSISRHLRDTVSWLTSEHMIVHYIQSLKRAITSTVKENQPHLSRDEIQSTKREAKELVLKQIPEILVNLVGQQAARNGAAKVFETVQDQKLNKQLFYELLEHLVNQLFPEILITYAEQKLRTF